MWPFFMPSTTERELRGQQGLARSERMRRTASENRKAQILNLLKEGKYIPQEILNEHDWSKDDGKGFS